MARLNQVLAVEKGVKARVFGEISEMHKLNKKPGLFNGFNKTYRAKDDDDSEKLPPEKQRVQFTVDGVLRRSAGLLTELMDSSARRDWTNCSARADVKLPDGTVLLPKVPATFLLFLEKQLTDLHTFVTELPVLDEAEVWDKDENSGLFRTDPVSTHRTKKLKRALVLYPATPEHPAQTALETEDVIVGFWDSVKYSGAMPKPEKEKLAHRIETLLRVVKEAREEANSIDESKETPKIGEALFGYLIDGV